MARQAIPNSGLWSSIAALLNTNFTELYTVRQQGIYNYDDASTSGSPISIVAPDTWYNLTNDGLGAQTIKYPLAGITDVWDTTSQSFDFSALELGDAISIRLDIEVTTGTANQDIDISLFLADDTGTPIEVPFIVEQSFKAAGSRKVLRYNGLFLGAALTKDNEARFKIRSSSAGSVVVNGWYVKVSPAYMEAP